MNSIKAFSIIVRKYGESVLIKVYSNVSFFLNYLTGFDVERSPIFNFRKSTILRFSQFRDFRKTVTAFDVVFSRCGVQLHKSM